jgi:hypothetical protein
MKIQELRIGSGLKLGDKYERIYKIEFERRDGHKPNGLLLSDLSPIPLTPELLQQFGFEYYCSKGVVAFDEPTNNEEDTHDWSMKIKRSEYCDSFTFSIVKWGNEGKYTFSNHMLRVRLEYLHQLQNLFFALTGTELTCKL